MTQVTIPPALGGDGLPFSDDGTSARDMQGQGYAANFFPMVAQAMSAVQMGVQAAGAIATASTNTNSTTSLAIGTGAKALTVETGKALVPGMWVLLANRANPAKNMTGQVNSYDAGTGALVLNVTGTSGSGTFADWAGSVTGAPAVVPGIARAAKTGVYTLVAEDKGALIDCSGTWTLGFDAAATLGAGWWCYVRNVGTSTITADPNGSELIDGVTSGAIRPGMTLLIQCGGTAFHCVRVGPHVAMEVLTSGTSWTVPLGVRVVKVRAQGPGSSGAIGSASNQTGIPGAAGGYSERIFSASPGDAATYVIGAAGAAAGSGSSVSGNAGGNTSWALNGVTITVNGGGVASPTGTSATGGSATGGTLNIDGRSSSNPGAGYGRQHGPSGVLGGYGAGGWGMTGGSTGNSGAGGDSCIVLEY